MARRTLIATARGGGGGPRRTNKAINSSSSSRRTAVASSSSSEHALAVAMPTSVREMDNSTLITLAAMQDHEACSEMLIRHIMTRERSSYESAHTRFQDMKQYHNSGMNFFLLPYQIGVVTAVTAAFSSIPLCFHLPTVHWFNELYVTTDIPEPQDLETWLEVGSWSWNWMEPPLGQVSFFLLCLQFSRAQLANLGIRPYTRHVKQYRTNRLKKKYPQYDSRIIESYSKTANLW